MTRARLLLLILLAAFPAYPQENSAPATQLPEDIAAQFEERITGIKAQERAAAALRKNLASAEGLAAEIYGGRIDALWAERFAATVKLANDIAAQQEKGFDVSVYSGLVAENLRAFPAESRAALERLRRAISYPLENQEPAQFAVQDQYLLRSTQKFDFVLQSMLTYLAVAERLGIEDESDTEYLTTLIDEAAAIRSTFLQLAIDNVTVMRAAAAAMPADTDMAARLSVSEARVKLASAALQSSISLMRQIGLDASHYSQQIVTATGELTADVLDVGVLVAIAREWSEIVSDLARTEGPQLLFRIFVVALILFIFVRLGRLVQALLKKALGSSRFRLSTLLTAMIVGAARNLVILLGVLVALSQVGITLGPLLAGLGIAGFIIGFALQDALSNFASGMLILIYRPFDVGDFVTGGGVTGTVKKMSLVNTTFATLDNQILIVPNNLIWRSVITNITAQRTRRVDLVFGVSYNDDIEKVEKILTDVVAANELVLPSPEPIIRLHELADSSVNFVVRPWVRTDDYWQAYWDLTRAVKVAFDAAGVTIPFPQRQIHTSKDQL